MVRQCLTQNGVERHNPLNFLTLQQGVEFVETRLQRQIGDESGLINLAQALSDRIGEFTQDIVL